MSAIWPQENFHYDLIVIGSGPGGQRAAVQAAKLGKQVLIIEKDSIGGSCLHRGTIPSKTLREAALRMISGEGDVLAKALSQAEAVIRDEQSLIERQLGRNKIQTANGIGSFLNSKTVQIHDAQRNRRTQVKGDFIIIATGTRPNRPSVFDFSQPGVYDSDTVLALKKTPQSMALFGAGVIGCEYASIFAKLGVQVSIIDKRPTLLKGVDSEVMNLLSSHFEQQGIGLHLSFDTEKVVHTPAGKIEIHGTQNGVAKVVHCESILCCMGRVGNVELLNLAAAGIQASERGVVSVNECYQTNVEHIYAVGDIQGSPALATSSAEQGRIAAASCFQHYCGKFPETFPYGIYTIPEISSVGLDEDTSISQNRKVVIGRARYKELARGRIIGDEHGFVKLLFCAETEKLLGVHCIGTGATELIHIGQVAIALGADVNFFLSNVFNYPTLAEAYKVAGYNAFNQIQALRKTQSTRKAA
jgi:NAD(P) transhydrogenase